MILHVAGQMTSLKEIETVLANGDRLTSSHALWLYGNAPSAWLREAADGIRRKLHGERAFYNRNIHFEPTNKCVYACRFCAFARTADQGPEDGAWDHDLEEFDRILRAKQPGTLTEVHITGGVHPDRGLDYGESLCRKVHEIHPAAHVKAFTAVEISFFARKSGLGLEEALRRLQAAGLGSLPGGGAEIFDPEVRRRIAGGKAPAHQWLEIHEIAHGLGLRSNATMLYGHVEEHRHRVDHMERLRDLQDRTHGFMAFIPLRYRNENNALSHLPEVSPEEDLRNYAVARLYLDNIPHLKAYWVMLGVELAAQALEWGVDDLDGTVDDSTKIYSMAGAEDQHPTMTTSRLESIISAKGRVAVERDSLYQAV